MPQSAPTDASGTQVPHPQIATCLDALKFERRLSPHTLESYTRELAVLQHLGAQHATNVDLTQLQSYHTRRVMAQLYGDDLSGHDITRVLSVWCDWFKWMALHDTTTAASPVDDVRILKSPERLPKALSVEQAVVLMEQLPGDDPETVRDRAVNELFYSCGLRLSGFVSLDIRHVKVDAYESASWLDLEAHEVQVLGRGSKWRIVSVGTKAAEVSAAWLVIRAQLTRSNATPEDAHVPSLSPRGRRSAQWQIQLHMKRDTIAADVPTDVYPHVPRHSFVTHILQPSGDLRAVQGLLGRASIASTQVYTSLDFQHLAKIYDQAHPYVKRKQCCPLRRANHPSRVQTLTLKPDRERSLLHRHSWIFTNVIDRVEGKPVPGVTVIVRAHNGQFLARAALGPVSQIRARMRSFGGSEPVDHALSERRIITVVTYRHVWVHDTDAVRLAMGEADGLPGLIVDQCDTGNAGRLVYQLSTAGMERWRQAIVVALVKEAGYPNVYERSDVSMREREGLEQITGVPAGVKPPVDLSAIKYSVYYYVDMREGHKAGLYMDQCDNRALVGALARDRDVPNCFCYTGGFPLTALKGETRSVVSIDSSGEALVAAERNVTLNGFGPTRTEWLDADVLEPLHNSRAEDRQSDLVVLDPPKLAASAQQVGHAAQVYKETNLVGMQLLRPGSPLLAYSYSDAIGAGLFQRIVTGAVVDAKVTAHIQRRLAGGIGHPLLTSFPEGEYLKGLLL